MIAPSLDPERLVMAIEMKRELLSYIKAGPQHLTIESYLCLASILSGSGWRLERDHWVKGEHRVRLLQAAVVELESQIKANRDQLLSRTVMTYRKDKV